jgi:hypothetical protein
LKINNANVAPRSVCVRRNLEFMEILSKRIAVSFHHNLIDIFFAIALFKRSKMNVHHDLNIWREKNISRLIERSKKRTSKHIKNSQNIMWKRPFCFWPTLHTKVKPSRNRHNFLSHAKLEKKGIKVLLYRIQQKFQENSMKSLNFISFTLLLDFRQFFGNALWLIAC